MKIKKTVIRFLAVIFAVALLVPALYILAVNRIEYDHVVELNGNTFFTGKVCNWNVFGIKRGNGLLRTRLLDIPGRTPAILLKVNTGHKGYIAAFGNDGILLYTKDGKGKKLERKYAYIQDACVSDLDGDKNSEIIVLTSETPKEYGDYMVIVNLEQSEGKISGLKEVYKFKCSDLNPWKVQTADVDGDGTVEISLGVYKTAPFHPEMAKRPYIYNWTGENGIFPKWRGSRLSRPFDDYVFGSVEAEGIDNIISIESTADGKKVLTSYIWKGFGFEKTAESNRFENISELAVKGKEIEAKIKDTDSAYKGIFIFDDGKLVLKKLF